MREQKNDLVFPNFPATWLPYTPSISEIIWVENMRAIVVCGFSMKWLKKNILKIWKKSWVPFGSYLLNSTANPAHGTHDFFQIFRIHSFYYFIKNPQTTIALTFLTYIISAIGGVPIKMSDKAETTQLLGVNDSLKPQWSQSRLPDRQKINCKYICTYVLALNSLWMYTN